MRYRSWTSGLSLTVATVAPCAAVAQADPPLKADVTLTAAPRIGKALPLDANDDPIDESDYSVALAIARPGGRLPWQARAGVASTPQLFDDRAPRSALSAEFTLGDNPIPLNEFHLAGTTPSTLATAVADTWRPYARYRYTNVRRAFLGGAIRQDEEAVVGVRFRDVRTIMCDRRMDPADIDGACSNVPGVAWEARGELVRLWSTDPSERRWVAMLRGELVSRPLAGGARLFARAQGEAMWFRDATVPLSPDRLDERRLRLTAGIDLTKWLSARWKGTTLEVAGQYQRRWSNDPSREHSRGYFVPNLTFKRPLPGS